MRDLMKVILIGILVFLFFVVIFILNRVMEFFGGSWIWSFFLCFFFMVLFLFVIVYVKGKWGLFWYEIWKKLFFWLKWSFIGFVFFYVLIIFVVVYGLGWLIVGIW